MRKKRKTTKTRRMNQLRAKSKAQDNDNYFSPFLPETISVYLTNEFRNDN